jgi:hypothetical protein
MLKEKPIKRTQLGPYGATADNSPTGGDDLSDLIAEAQALQKALGFSRFEGMWPWCDDGAPDTADRWGLECLVERLCILWVNRGHGVV